MLSGSQVAKRKKIVMDWRYQWQLVHRYEPTNLMVISGDILDSTNDYVPALQLAKEDNNINIFLALARNNPTELLLGLSTNVWLWSTLLNGERPLNYTPPPCFFSRSGPLRCLCCNKKIEEPPHKKRPKGLKSRAGRKKKKRATTRGEASSSMG